jgi:hypothetical protein
LRHHDADLFNGSLELIKVDAAFVLDVEVLELTVQEGGLVDITGVLLVYLISELLVESA